MKKKILSGVLAIALLFGSAAALPEGVFTESASITASAATTLYEYNNVDGGTEKNYSSKYKCTILIYGRPECGNTRGTIVNASQLASNKDINVVFVDIDANSKDKIKAFKNSMNVGGVKFCYDESGNANSHSWYYTDNFHDTSRENVNILPAVAFINSEGKVVNASTSKLEYDYLAKYAKECGAEISDVEFLDEEISFDVTYQQGDARKMLKKINAFRTGNNAWAWNEDNTEKIKYSGLGKLQVDYELEKAAMQRAAELVVLYSHTRPNGEICSTAVSSEFGYYIGENIAIGYTSADAVFEAWKEEDDDYSGQGHRRNMLNGNYRSIGIAHVKYRGCDYWVQEFSDSLVDTDYKAPNNKNTKVKVEIKDSIVEKDGLSVEKTAISIKENEKVKLPAVTRTLRVSGQWSYAPDVVLKPNVKWNIKSGKDIVKISSGSIVPLKAGTAVLNAKVNNKTVSVKVTVSHNWSAWKTTKKVTCTTAGTKSRTCSACGKKETQTIKATGHKFSAWKTTGINLKTRTSTQTRKCANCGKTEKKTTQNAFTRFAGTNRYDTAARISKGTYPNGSGTVIIATGLDYHDALVAVPLAKVYNAPLLLVTNNMVTKQTETELARLKAKKVIIVSTNSSVGGKVRKALKKYNPTVISGSTYSETSVNVAKAIQKKAGKSPSAIFFATENAFADALSASPVAAIKNAPIIYLEKDTVDYDVLMYLWGLGWDVKNAYIIGGAGVISNNVMKTVANYLGLTVNKTVVRVAGKNRYETCVAVNNKFKSTLSSTGICVAKGLDFPDALAGGVYAAMNRQALFLADGKKLQDVQNSYLKTKNASKITVFGGTGAVPDELVKLIAQASV